MGNIRPRTIIEYFGIVWRHKLLVVLFAAAVMLAALNAMAPVRNVYEASALVAITAQSSDERSAIDVQLAAVNQHLVSRANLEPIISRYNLYGENSNLEASVALLRKDLKVDVKMRDYYPQFPISFTITYRHNDPVLAMQVANDLVSFFNFTNEVNEKRNTNQARVLGDQITEIENRLRQINQQRTASQMSFNAINTIKAQRTALLSAINILSDKELGDNQRVIEQKKIISEQENLVKALPYSLNSTTVGSSAYGVLLADKARLEAQLKDQKLQYTDKNSKVILTQTQIAEVNKQLASLEEKSNQSGISVHSSQEMRDLKNLKRDLANYELELELTQRSLKRKREALELLPHIDVSPAEIAAAGAINNLQPSGEPKVNDSGDEYSLLFNRYSVLAEKRDSLIRFEAAKGESSLGIFQIVDKPVVPNSPVAPNRLKLLLVAFVMAIGVGLMAAFAVEIPKFLLIQSERDVEYLLGAQVIGLIPETLTPSDSRRNRKFLFVRGLSILLLAATLVPVLAVLFKKFQVFQILAK